MEDFFLKNSKEMSNENMTMRKAALAPMPSGPVPYAAANGKKRVEIYDPREGKKRKLEPYSANAKELYRFLDRFRLILFVIFSSIFGPFLGAT